MTGISVAEKRAEYTAEGKSWPLCECHGEPMRWHSDRIGGGYMLCAARNRVANMTPEQIERKRARDRQRSQRNRVANMTPEQIERRRARNRVANMTPEQIERRRERQREGQRIANMTPEQIERKRARDSRRLRVGRAYLGYAKSPEEAQVFHDHLMEKLMGFRDDQRDEYAAFAELLPDELLAGLPDGS